MKDIDIRGGLPADAPLELTGDWTGYNNGATMQVGLWIRNDGEYINEARDWAALHGTREMAEYLIRVLRLSGAYSPPGQAWRAVPNTEEGAASIDWAQIAYDLIGTEPDDKDLQEARLWVEEGGLPVLSPTESQLWHCAARRRAERVRSWVLEGVR